MLSIGVEGHVPRPGARRDRCKRHRVRTEYASTGVEVQHVYLIGAEVDAEHMVAIQIGEDLVGVRTFLPGGIRSSPVADALELVGPGADKPVSEDPKNRKVPAGVVGREEVLPGRLHAEMGGVLAVRRLCVEKAQHSVRLVDRVGAYMPVGHLVDRIQMLQRRVEREIRWVRRRHGLERLQSAIARIQPEHIDADGGARVGSAGRDPWSGVGSDIDKPRLGAGWLARGVGRCCGEHTARGTNRSGGRT